MTRRERLERKAEKRRDWAESAEKRSNAAYEAERAIGDQIPFGQPILVGHHSERRARRDVARMQALASKHVEESDKAEHHRSAADGIDRALATSVFSDDEDAVERLTEIVAGLEAERDRWKAYNASCKRGTPDLELLDEKQRETVATVTRVVPYQLGKHGEISYTNLSATIRQKKKRIEEISRLQAAAAAGVRIGGRVMTSRFESECADCGEKIARGETIVWYRSTREAIHRTCPAKEENE